MRVAIATALFDDQQRIGSQRPRALASELAALGHEVTVFTVGSGGDTSGMPPEVSVVRLGPLSWEDAPKTRWAGLTRKIRIAWAIAPTVLPLRAISRRAKAGSETTRDSARLREIQQKRRSSITSIDAHEATRRWLAQAKTRLTNALPSNSSTGAEPAFDVVFSTFGPLGRLFRSEGFARSWIQDFRDPASLSAFLPSVTRRILREQKALLAEADAITAVSAGVKDALVSSLPDANDKVTVLHNGFRKRLTGANRDLTPGPLKIGYVGAIYGERSKALTTFMSEVARLSATSSGAFEVHYAGKDFATFSRCAQNAHIEELIHNHGELSHDGSLEMQAGMDALLVLTWNTRQSQGVLSGKFLEYLGADLPVIAMVTGEEPGSELANLVRQLNIGICCEETGGDKDLVALREWLADATRARAEGAPVPFAPNTAEVAQFEYGQIASRLAKLAESLT